MDIITNIISYLKYLHDTHKLNVSIHFDQGVFNRLPQSIVSRLIPHNCHTNAYCLMAKGINHDSCILNQKNLLKKCTTGEGFLNTCYAGVHEYIYPIYKKNNIIGFIAISGYRQTTAMFNILNHELWNTALTSDKIPITLCNTVIPPLSIMLEQMLIQYLTENDSEYNLILQFLAEYHTNISLSDLSNYFNMSKSHISHLFKKENGMSIRAYCNQLKLADAKKLLLTTNAPITEVAFESGFNDVSYFIHLFKKNFGISPLQYRLKCNQV